MSIRNRLASITTVLALAFTAFANAAPATADDDVELPIFTTTGPIVDPNTTETWNPTKEFIFPSVFHAAEYLDEPLAEWYIYYAPHDSPGGINLMYSDDLNGPWTQYAGNPIVSNDWQPHYRVSHVSSPDVVYNEDAGKVVLYFHGENNTDRYATSDDGLSFTYGGVTLNTTMFGQNSTEVSYNRIFHNPEVENQASETYGYKWAQYFMVNDRDNIRRIGLALSHDGFTWEPQPGWVVEPTVVEGTNVAAPEFWQYQGQNYVLYHGTVGKIFAKKIDENLRSYDTPEVLYVPDVVPPETGRAASPQIIEWNGETHMFYESGVRSHTTIMHARLNPGGARDPLNKRPNDPMYEQCSAPGSDEFQSTQLGSQWSVVRGTANSNSPRLTGDALVLDTAVAATRDFGLAPTVRQAITTPTWEYTTELEFAPTEIHQQAGLFLHRDDRNNARAIFGFARQGDDLQLRFDFTWKRNNADRFNSWVWEDAYFPGDTVGDRVWLRVTNNGEYITASLSVDGHTFMKLGQPIPAAELAPTTVGLGAARSSANLAQIPAAFNWFRSTPNVADPLSCDLPPGTQTPNPFPVFTSTGEVVDRFTTETWNPTNEFIFPSVFHAGEYLDEPLGEWYIYYAPHDAPGGINLMYSDDLNGPWTQYAGNPIIRNQWGSNYRVSHVSAPDVVYNEDADKIVLYFHGENTTDRYATSDDGLSFDYGGVFMSTSLFGRGATETSYNRIFKNPEVGNPDSDGFGYEWAQFFMVFDNRNARIALAYSHDGFTWDAQPGWVVEPGDVEGKNVSGAEIWHWEGKNYVLYGSSVGTIFGRELDENLRAVGPPHPLYIPSAVPPEDGRVGGAQIVEAGGQTHLFFEGGGRLTATIMHGVLDPNGLRDPINPRAYDPLYEQCQAPGSDEFSGDSLGSQWSVIRDQPGRYRFEDGALVMTSPTTAVGGATLPQAQLPDGPWQVTTELSYNPVSNYQQAGLVLYVDDLNNAKVIWGHATGGQRFDFTWKKNGVDRFDSWALEDSTLPPSNMGDKVWFRVSSDGSWITAAVSTDGQTFATLGRSIPTAEFNPKVVGPTAFRGTVGAPDTEARFNWIRFTPNAADPTSCDPSLGYLPKVSGTLDGRTVTLEAHPWGSATINALNYKLGDALWRAYEGPFEVPGTGAVTILFAARDSYNLRSVDGRIDVPASGVAAGSVLALGQSQTLFSGDRANGYGVRITTASGAPLVGEPVTFRWEGSASGELTGTTAVTNVAGIAPAPAVIVGGVGEGRLVATHAGIDYQLPSITVAARVDAEVDVTVSPQLVAGKWTLNVAVTGLPGDTETVRIKSRYGSKNFTGSADIAQAFKTFTTSLPSGTVTVTVTTPAGDQVHTASYDATPRL